MEDKLMAGPHFHTLNSLPATRSVWIHVSLGHYSFTLLWGTNRTQSKALASHLVPGERIIHKLGLACQGFWEQSKI